MTDDNQPQIAEEVAALEKSLTTLEGHLPAMRLRLDHYGSDLMFYSYGTNVYENAQGVLHLLKGGWVGAAYPCARAAVEAAQDAMMLLAWDDIDEAGARAYAYSKLEWLQIRLRFINSARWDNVPAPTSYDELRLEITSVANNWNSWKSGTGDKLRAAFDYFEPAFSQSKRVPNHWTEMSRRQMAAELQKKGTGSDTFDRDLITIYALLSRATHPGLRPENWSKVRRPDGKFAVQISGRNQHVPATAARVAVDLMNQAFTDFTKHASS
jgi:hypothetical protein